MKSSQSLAGRAVLAVILMLGFYLLAAAIAGGLLYLPYAEMVHFHRVHLKLALVCLFGALVILWSVLPRFDSFEAPGPQLTRDQHPLLFDELEGVARAVNQAMPAEVFLVPDVNAWVAQRGGLMGFGSRRVMGLGLPLMRMLTRSQFRAVLAHEFGHYHSGDTRVGPWIYKTRSAIGRTLGSLGDGSPLQLPFLWYGKMFLRITHAISRNQEFVADELAARTVGSQPLIDGLRVIHGAAPAYNAYLVNECAPVLSAGFRPPLAEGFQRFLSAGKIAAAIHQHLDEELKTGKVDPYDTHPPLKERIAALEYLPAGDVGPNDPPATTLLAELAALEEKLFATMVNPDVAGKLQPIAWADVFSHVYLPQWLTLVRANAPALAGLTPEALPHHAADLNALNRRMRIADGQSPAEPQAEGLASAVIGAALTLQLLKRGGKISAEPGQPVSATVGAVNVETFGVLGALAAGKLTADAWRRQCGELGLWGVDLGTSAPPDENAGAQSPPPLPPRS